MSGDQNRSPLEDLFSDDVAGSQQQSGGGERPSTEPDQGAGFEAATRPELSTGQEFLRATADREDSFEQIDERISPSRSDQRVAAPALKMEGDDRALDIHQRITEERERILNILLAGATIGGGVAVLALAIGAFQHPERLVSYIPFMIGYALIVGAYVLRRIPRRWRIGILIGVSYAVALFSIWQNGVVSTAPWYLMAIPLLLFVLVGVRAGLVSGVVNSVLYVLLASAYHFGGVSVQVPIVLENSFSQFSVVSTTFVLITAIIVVVQVLFARAQQRTRQSLEAQGRALRETHAQSAQRQQDLERANKTLRRHADHFDLSVQVGQIAAMGLTMDEFAKQAVALMLERVEAYYVGLFILNDERTEAQLEAIAGVEWKALSPNRRRLAIEDDMLLRQCVGSGRSRILLGIDHVRSLSGEGEASGILLETTQSALALPLIARGQVFGVITLQSRSPTAYRNEDLVSLRGVADQVATAISNAQLAQELQARIRAMEILQQYYVREEWEEFLGSHQNLWYEYDQPGISALEEDSTPQVNRVLAHPQLTVLDAADDAEAPAALLSPISLRDQVLGVLGFHEMDRDKEWTEDQIELVAAVAQQLGLIIENSRLFAEARSRAARERTVREITARVRQSLDLDTVLQTAAWEMGEALNLQDITVHLGVDDLEASEE